MKKIAYKLYIYFHGFCIGLLLMMHSVYSSEKGDFSIEPLSEPLKKEMKEKGTWNSSCPVSLEQLSLLRFSHIDFEGKEKIGELVVLDAIAPSLLEAFKALYEKKFPIAKARRIEHYEGNDEASMADNNTVAFNCRPITGGSLFSLHAYGVAIDINPLQNPYVSFQEKPTGNEATILPSGGSAYINRTNQRPGMLEACVDVFRQHGFSIWGGKWNTPIDWQHFQPSRAVAQLLAEMSLNDGRVFFEAYKKDSHLFNAVDAQDNQFVSLYKKNPQRFMKILEQNQNLMGMEPEEALLKFLP